MQPHGRQLESPESEPAKPVLRTAAVMGNGQNLEAVRPFTALGFIGITRVHQIAIEGQEVGGELLAESVKQALAKVDALVAELQRSLHTERVEEPA